MSRDDEDLRPDTAECELCGRPAARWMPDSYGDRLLVCERCWDPFATIGVTIPDQAGTQHG